MLLKVPGVKWAAQRVFRAQRSVTLGVRAILIDGEGRVLLVRHGYAHGWHFPGGGVDRGESIHAAVVREVREETGAETTAPPQLLGMFTNFEAFPGDHIATFVVRDFTREAAPAASFEIREQGFFALSALPPETTDGTRRRLAEVFDGVPVSATW
jgi:ADP-ribose pyrophosphatase YjhB (NUDIX family)